MLLTFLGTVSSHIEHFQIGHSSRWFSEIFWLQIFWENWYKHLPTCGATLKNVTFGQILNKIGPIYITTSCHTVSYYWSQWVDGIRQDIFPDDPNDDDDDDNDNEYCKSRRRPWPTSILYFFSLSRENSISFGSDYNWNDQTCLIRFKRS